jgi:ribosome-associated inhibitor A
MLLDITSKTIEITPSIRDVVASKFEKLEKMQVPLITPHVVIGKEGENYVVNSTISIPSGKLHAEAEHIDLYAAINQVEQKLERQILKYMHRPEAQRNKAGAPKLIDNDE